MSRGLSTTVKALLSAFRLPRMVILVEFNTLGLRLTNWPRSITINSKTYTGARASANKFVLRASGLGENLDFEAPSAVLEIHSLNGWAQAYFFSDSFRGDTVTISLLYISGNSFLETGWTTTYACDAEEVTADVVKIRLASIDAVAGVEAPQRMTQEEGCQFDFQVGGCTFRFVQGVHAAALAKCSKSYDGPNGCKDHFPDVTDPDTGTAIPRPKPYGAFLGSIDHRLVKS